MSAIWYTLKPPMCNRASNGADAPPCMISGLPHSACRHRLSSSPVAGAAHLVRATHTAPPSSLGCGIMQVWSGGHPAL